MFKLFYKSLLITLVSVSLTAFDFSVAYAQSSNNPSMSRGSDGVVSKTETHTTEKVEDDDIMASVMMFAALYGTMVAITAGKPVFDVYMAGAGALALIAGELMTTMGHKTALDAMTMQITKRSDGQNDQAQIDLLNAQKKSYDDAKKTLETKQKFQQAAAVIYIAAAAALAVAVAACDVTVIGIVACKALLIVKNNDQNLKQHSRGGYQLLTQLPKKDKSFITMFLDFVLPKAEAGLLPSGLGLLGGVLGYITSTGVSMRYAMEFPEVRIGVWLVIGGLCLAAADATGKQAKKAQDNADKIDKILKEMNSLKKGLELKKMNEQQIKLGNLQGAPTEVMSLTGDPSVRTECLLSAGSTNCKSMEDTLQAMAAFQNLPDSLKALGSQAARLGDGLSGTSTVSPSTYAAASSLAGQKGAIKKLQDFTKRKLNDALAKAKKPKMDFDKEQAKMLRKMKAAVAKDLKSHNMTPSEFLASVGASPSPSTAIVDTAASKGKVAAAAAVAVAAQGKAKDDLNFDFKEVPKEADALGLGASAAADASKNDGLDVGSNDIHTDSGLNIFEVISNRYFKSGYPKLLEEIPAKN